MTIDFNLYDSFSIKVLAFIQQALLILLLKLVSFL
jgi:hypothetical protein